MASLPSSPAAPRRAPKGPVLGWSSFRREDAPDIPSIEDLPHTAFTTSGRSAIYQALLLLRLAPGSVVLVPTYHCPTMVAPVLLAGHRPAYFGIRSDGLPNIEQIDQALAGQARAMLVSHYFGLARSLHDVRQWCDAHGIALIEDCAHCYFGQAGERPIGGWGDYSTASLSKFFPVPEAGLLASAQHAFSLEHLQSQGLKAQVKGVVDVLETASNHQRLRGLNALFELLFRLKRKARVSTGAATASATPDDPGIDIMRGADMARIGLRPLLASRLIGRMLPRGHIIAQRARNFARFAQLLADLPGGRPLFNQSSQPTAPYVFPFWVDDAERIYHALRAEGVPVFRWDRLWPGTPQLPGDAGPDWSHHVLQLLCHQDLSAQDIDHAAQRLATALRASAAQPAPPPASAAS
ncbi:DegT/DnrJ/EryC1/StrS family aminotransferase [Pseudorhodoferax sp.]|uniref:DegT/DnrJ/EryC1/StrS family aminotransferase n=1 Tax=Pseudorhodoferax sp. TaxID=1993553 RepID=UPI002DD6470C|nr:DegT/DnrJ/EryC1/StrS family aminotransferase [Pseudorhodoferax sp.]